MERTATTIEAMLGGWLVLWPLSTAGMAVGRWVGGVDASGGDVDTSGNRRGAGIGTSMGTGYATRALGWDVLILAGSFVVAVVVRLIAGGGGGDDANGGGRGRGRDGVLSCDDTRRRRKEKAQKRRGMHED